MALIKKKMTDLGVEASYWRVGMISIDTNLKEVSFSLNLLLNKETKKPIDIYCVSDLMGLEDKTLYDKYFRKDFGINYKDIYTACYMYAKENVEFFKDAADDEEELSKLN